jgi:tetratricopeptide (TPR) repeat protein
MRAVAESTELSAREVLARYPALREDHLRYLEKWGLVRPVQRGPAGRCYGFQDLAVIRQTVSALESGRSLRAIIRTLDAERHGQLSLDFRLEAEPARVLMLTPRDRAVPEGTGGPSAADISKAEQLFLAASSLDGGDPQQVETAAGLYRKALEIDPWLVAALINLGNIHYAQSRLAEAQALYEQAVQIAPEFFEARYNLANVLHDVGRLEEAVDAYRAALELEPRHGDAHFYLAVTLEKMGRSADARPYWQAYRTIEPQGAWAALAKEFTEQS